MQRHTTATQLFRLSGTQTGLSGEGRILQAPRNGTKWWRWPGLCRRIIMEQWKLVSQHRFKKPHRHGGGGACGGGACGVGREGCEGENLAALPKKGKKTHSKI